MRYLPWTCDPYLSSRHHPTPWYPMRIAIQEILSVSPFLIVASFLVLSSQAIMHGAVFITLVPSPSCLHGAVFISLFLSTLMPSFMSCLHHSLSLYPHAFMHGAVFITLYPSTLMTSCTVPFSYFLFVIDRVFFWSLVVSLSCSHFRTHVPSQVRLPCCASACLSYLLSSSIT